MKNVFYCLIIFAFLSCTSQKITTTNKNTAIVINNNKPLAFPTAEGFGKFTTGGRGGKVFIVSNLNNAGSGSFREAVETKEKRIIVFSVSGTIHLLTKISIKGDVTIAGQTAPGDGICIADNTVSFGGDNIIVRYMRFRLGDKFQKGGMVDGNGGDDAFGGNKRKNIIIDHCTTSWSTDEVFSIYGGDSTTLQWNIMSEPLNYSYHFEKGDTGYEHHGYGAIWGGNHFTAHHNLFAHCNSRNPRFNGIRTGGDESVDFRNNVIYNWGHNSAYAGEGGIYNMVNNYYKYGPDTKNNVKSRIMNPWKKEPIPFGKFYIAGNFVEGSNEVIKDNWVGVQFENATTEEKKNAKLENEFPVVSIHTESANDAYINVLKNVGCSLPQRDTLDVRIINDVRNRKGNIIDVQGGYSHGTPYELTVNAWPTLKALPAPKDTDQDGMPDDWEIKNNLDPNNPIDANSYNLNKNYTNIEVYINSLCDKNL